MYQLYRQIFLFLTIFNSSWKMAFNGYFGQQMEGAPPVYQENLPSYGNATTTAWIPPMRLRPYPNNGADYMILDAQLAIKLTQLVDVIKTNAPGDMNKIWDYSFSTMPGETIPLPVGRGWYDGHREDVAIFFYLRGDQLYELQQSRPGVFQLVNKNCGHNVNGIGNCLICRLCRYLVESCSLHPINMAECDLVLQMYQ